MADYKLEIHFVGGECFVTKARDQIDDIEEFTRRVSNTNSGYFTKTSLNDVYSCMVNTNNVTYMKITKE